MGGAAAGAGVVALTGDVYAYRRIADDLRTRITTGELKPGQRLPAEPALVAQYGVTRGTVRHAVQALRDEGLVEVRLGFGTFVRGEPDRTDLVDLKPGDRAYTRMPTRDERRQLQIGPGVPVLVVTRASGEVEVFDGDATELRAGPA